MSEEFSNSHVPPVELIPYEGFQITSGDKPRVLIKGEIKPGEAELALKTLVKLNKQMPDINIYKSSLAFYGVVAKNQATTESGLFSVLSILSILGIFWFYFRTLRHLIIALAIIMTCCLVGFFISSFIFGSLHLMTVLLGISILGIMADYFIHFFIKESSEGVESGKQAFEQLSKPLLWSLGTSVCGFSLFIFAPLPILKQFAVFTSATLLVSYLSVRYLLPFFYLSRNDQKNSSVKIVLNEKLYFKLGHVRGILFCLPVLFFILAQVFWKNNFISNDIRKFSAPNEELKNDEDKIRKILDVKFGYELFIVKGESADEVLLNEQELKHTLKLAPGQAEFFSDWVPPKVNQLKSHEAHSKVPNYTPLSSGDISPSTFLSQFSDVEFARLWLGKVGNHFYSIVPLYTTLPPEKVLNDSSKSWVYMNKMGFINHDLAEFMQWLQFGGVGFIVMFSLFLIFKLGPKGASRIVAPPLLGIAMALSAIVLFKGQLDLFNFLGCILIFALGLDYAFFYYFNRAKEVSTAKGIEISTLTTLASFGIMALSSTQAVNSFGMTVLIGILTTWIIIPMSANIGTYEKH